MFFFSSLKGHRYWKCIIWRLELLHHKCTLKQFFKETTERSVDARSSDIYCH